MMTLRRGLLSDIKRFYIQDGTTYEMPYSTWPGLTDMNSLTDDQCSAAKKLFGDKDDHKVKGGLAQLGVAMKRAMVLTMSLWTDHARREVPVAGLRLSGHRRCVEGWCGSWHVR